MSAGDYDATRAAARRRLPRGLFEFIDRGAEAETALLNNTAAFARLRLRPLSLVDVSRRSTAAALFGRPLAMPVIIAPTGAAGVVRPGGDLALARAAAEAGIPVTLAMRSMSPIEAVVAAANGRAWFQLYPGGDGDRLRALIDRAAAAGVEALVVTVDTSVTPLRTYNAVNDFALPFRPLPRALRDMALRPRWLAALLAEVWRTRDLPRFETMPDRPRITEGPPAAAMLAGGLDWQAMARLRARWRGPFLLKGTRAVNHA